MPHQSKPVIAFGFRDEDVEYRSGDRCVWMTFTWTRGPRVYPAGSVRWTGGDALTDEEKTTVFAEVLRYIAEEDSKPTVIINVDDPSRAVWEHVCSLNSGFVQAVEYTSDQEQDELEREGYLRSLRSSGGLSVDGVDIVDEQQLDDLLSARRKGKNSAR